MTVGIFKNFGRAALSRRSARLDCFACGFRCRFCALRMVRSMTTLCRIVRVPMVVC